MPIDREQLARDLRPFQSSEGPQVVAAKIHRRVLADLFYLGRVRLVGQAQAGAETCARFGVHEVAGGRCTRCGAPRR
jgi:hypothetical protein